MHNHQSLPQKMEDWLLLIRLPIFVTEDGIDTCINDEQELKALLSIDIKDEGKIICASFEQHENEESPIVSACEGIVTCANEQQLEKVPFSITVSFDEFVICTNFMQYLKASFPTDFTDGGIIICVNV